MEAVSVEAAATLDTAGGVVVMSGCGTSGRVAFVVATVRPHMPLIIDFVFGLYHYHFARLIFE